MKRFLLGLAGALFLFGATVTSQATISLPWPGPGTPASSGGGSNLTVLDCNGTCGHDQNTGSSLFPVLTTTQGSGVVVVCVLSNLATPAPTITSTHLTFTQQLQGGSGVNEIYEFTAPYTTNLSSETITVNMGSATFGTADAFGVGLAKTSSFLDGSGATGTSDPLSISGSNAFDFIAGCFRMQTTSNPTAGSGYTKISGADFQLAEYKTTTVAPSSLSITIGTGVGDANGGVALAIKSQ